jgi:hypothetical protein
MTERAVCLIDVHTSGVLCEVDTDAQTNMATQTHSAPPKARLSGAHGNQRWSCSDPPPPIAGALPPDCQR